jgi:hypothetical protein
MNHITKVKDAARLISGIVLVAVMVMTAVPAAPALAHVQSADNGVSAVMHIYPDDNPIAAESTYIQFTFGGSRSDFDVADCACAVQVVNSQGRTVSEPLVEPADQTSTLGHVSVTFPDAGIYRLKLSGYTTAAQSERFSLDYTLRVSPAGTAPNLTAGINVVLVSLASLAVVGIFAFYNIREGMRYTTHK